jgi:TusA-related sulfurtransferase
LLEFSAALRGMKSGEAARVIIDRDPAVEDIRRWCEATGDEVVSVERGGEAGAAGGTGERPDGRGNPLRISIVVRKK